MRSPAFFLAFAMLISCIDEQTIINEIVIINVKPDPLKGIPDEGPLQFDNPAIGQRSYYVFFKAFRDNGTNNARYEYTTDTLVLGIAGKESDRWILKEFLTPGSQSIQTNKGYFKTDSVYVTLFQLTPDSIIFSRPSNSLFSTYFFTFYENNRLSLSLAPVTEPAKQNPACSPFFSLWPDTMGYALDYSQLGQTFDHVNIYVDNTKVELDGAALMYVYGHTYGFVRATVHVELIQLLVGWDLAPRQD